MPPRNTFGKDEAKMLSNAIMQLEINKGEKNYVLSNRTRRMEKRNAFL